MPPDFEIATKREVASGSTLEEAAEGLRVEVVEEMHPRRLGEAPEARHGVVRELRQRLAAEARSAGAEEDDVRGAVPEPRRGGADRVEVPGLGRQAKERQAPARVVLGEALRGARDAGPRRVERRLRQPGLADVRREREIDRLLQRHALSAKFSGGGK